MPPVSECIVNFLRAQRENHTGQDLLDRYLEHGIALETQVNVAAGTGEPVAGKRATWTDGTNEWWNLRVPKGAMDSPTFNDYNLTWPLELHAEGIGSTGWNWKDRVSLWVGFDFDSLLSHAEGVGISKQDMLDVRRKASELPYVETRKSTGGSGIHLYCYLDRIPTANHTEHAALARCILGMMSSEAGYNFAAQIDCCGSIMWIWHRKMAVEKQGLALEKAATRVLTIADLPANWKDHIDVVNRKRSKVRIDGIDDKGQDQFEQLTSARPIISLDSVHKATIDELARSGFSTVWIPDYHLCQTHTAALKGLMEDAQICGELGLKGVFDTTSTGSDTATPNCFMFPLMNGAWKVYRFGKGTGEHETWKQDGEGWTTCYYNRSPDLSTASRAVGGVELENGSYQFRSAKKAIEAANMIGQEIGLEEVYLHRAAELKSDNSGRLVMRVEARKDEAKPALWATVKNGWMQRIFPCQTSHDCDGSDPDNDKVVRALLTPDGKDAGLLLKNDKGWIRHSSNSCKMALQRIGLTKTAAEMTMGGAIMRPFVLECRPFEPLELTGRRMNLGAAQYVYLPSNVDPSDTYHPHWDLILEHCFSDLDEAIKVDTWMQRNNIRNGAQYGLMWITCLLRDPYARLPFLFLFGNQNCGKSIFHEALSLLVTGGVVDASKPLTTKGDFNGELENGLLAVIEETDIAGSPYAYNRMKDWITSRRIWIRRMRTDAYPVPNLLHFVMCANSESACPIVSGDTRITMSEVSDLVEDIPKQVLLQHLQDEAPHFMRSIMAPPHLPELPGRLRLPVVNTHQKLEQAAANDMEATWITENLKSSPGNSIFRKEVIDRYEAWCKPLAHSPCKQAFGRRMKSIFGAKVAPKNKGTIGNERGHIYNGVDYK